MAIFSFLSGRSMQTKTFLSLGIIGGLSLSGMLLGFLCSRTVANDYAQMLNSNSRLEILAVQIADHMHRVSRDEFAYIMKRDQKLLDRRKEALDQVYQDINEARAIPQTIISQSQLEAFEGDIKAYQKYFEVIARHLVEEGNAESGILGELRRTAHAMEKILKENTSADQPRVMVSYLMIRRHEKDYLARRDRSYIDKLDGEIKTLRTVLQKSQFKESDRSAILLGAEDYKEKLSRMNDGYLDLMEQRARQDTALQSIESFILKVNAEVRAHNSERMLSLASLVQSVNLTFVGAALLTLLIIFLSAKQFAKLTRSLVALSKTIGRSGEKNLKTSVDLQRTSEKTSAAASEQASAIQETVTTINEISAMVGKSVESATMSAQKAEMSFQISMEGKKSVDHMRNAMQAIQAAMTGMIDQNHAGNQRITAILGIIEKIAERTNVINDIVFQTKLLSFNASVEAARAGEHGKGFAIVAEEVGTLARMSGEAARAIGDLLRSSRAEVATIIQESKEQTELLSQAGSEKVESGVQIANRCDEILTEVVDHVESVKKLMGEISAAAKEEADGIHNITTAMNELDETTAINSDMAHETMTFSNLLHREAQALNGAVHDLSRIVLGAGHRPIRIPRDPDQPAPKEPLRLVA